MRIAINPAWAGVVPGAANTPYMPAAGTSKPVELSSEWDHALERFDRELQRRGAADSTRRAYGSDLRRLAAWADSRSVSPTNIAYRDLRSYAASLSEAGLAKASVARKLASARSFFDFLTRIGELSQNPADLIPSPKRDSRLPRVLGPDEVRTLLERIPVSEPLSERDRALFELAYSCGLRCEEIVNLDLGDVDFEGERIRAHGKGDKTRMLPIGEPAQRAVARYLERARPALASRARGAGALPLPARQAALSVRRSQEAGPVGPRGGAGRPRLPAHAAALVRHPPSGGRCRPAIDPGAARAFERLDHADLHPSRALTPAQPVRTLSSEGMSVPSEQVGH